MYNENDPKAAAWLEELVRRGAIPSGLVDRRSIVDVDGSGLDGRFPAHFFAGIGGWGHALRLAGIRDDAPIWTGSCPCQPFSVAGKGAGENDKRHLWPEFRRLIAECAPPVVFGEQVASPAGRKWLAAVSTDLEGLGYAVASADLCAAGVGAPHIRQRIYFGAIRLDYAASLGRVRRRAGEPRRRAALATTFGPSDVGGLADSDDAGSQRRIEPGREGAAKWLAGPSGVAGGLADTDDALRRSLGLDGGDGRNGADDRRAEALLDAGARGQIHGLADALLAGRAEGRTEPGDRPASGRGDDCGLADAERGAAERHRQSLARASSGMQGEAPERQRFRDDAGNGVATGGWSRAPDDPWRNADWLLSRDDRWRPVEPGTFPLAHGVPARVGRLRGYGNAIVPQAAAQFVLGFLESCRDSGVLEDVRDFYVNTGEGG